MFRRAWIVAASSVLLVAGCQDPNKNQQMTAKKDEPQPYNSTPTRSLDSMDNNQNPAPRTEPAYSQNPPAKSYNYDEANNPPSENMTPSKGSSKARSSGDHTSAGAGRRSYTVQKGDTLEKIAKKMYGDSTKWKKIADANKSKTGDPKKLKVGTKLVIP